LILKEIYIAKAVSSRTSKKVLWVVAEPPVMLFRGTIISSVAIPYILFAAHGAEGKRFLQLFIEVTVHRTRGTNLLVKYFSCFTVVDFDY
jgi:hypothetical protein